ncbi:MAG: N-acetylmuramoyl-L-alanine amidase [Luteolibacter sp.]|uniref:N-acetylmuramoyl-L-alanine amidase family protein n=1 Tax=Luteolibacter sp. TaxID=1962973 RepID=UPI003266ED76
MSSFLKITFAASFAAFFVSCAAPTAPSSSGRDVYGHRPGPKGFKTVIIDAGHGGKDSGATSPHTGQHEKDLALDTAKRIANDLSRDFKVVMMRSDDTFVDLDERVARANQYGGAILVSMHYNSGPSGIRGPETYYWRVDSHGLAVRCQKAMAGVSPVESGNRGMVRRRIRLTRNPEIPCLLLEGGYLSNAAESRQISDPGYRQKLANAIAGAIRTQAAVGDAGTGPLPPPLNAPPSRPTDAHE